VVVCGVQGYMCSCARESSSVRVEVGRGGGGSRTEGVGAVWEAQAAGRG
jgi:hypothetical protein